MSVSGSFKSVNFLRLVLLSLIANIGFCHTSFAQNLNPTVAQYDAATGFLDVMDKLYESDLTPPSLKKNFNINLSYIQGGDYIDEHKIQKTRQLTGTTGIAGTSIDRFDIEWGSKDRIMFWVSIDDSKICISDKLLKSRYGSSIKFSQSTMRHFAPREVVPIGLRPTQDSWSYTAKNGSTFSYLFDYACAEKILITSNKFSADWYAPENDPLKTYIDKLPFGIPYNDAKSIVSDLGFECSAVTDDYTTCKKQNGDGNSTFISMNHRYEKINMVHVNLSSK